MYGYTRALHKETTWHTHRRLGRFYWLGWFDLRVEETRNQFYQSTIDCACARDRVDQRNLKKWTWAQKSKYYLHHAWMTAFLLVFYLYILILSIDYILYILDIMTTKHTASGNCNDIVVCGVCARQAPDEWTNDECTEKSFRCHFISINSIRFDSVDFKISIKVFHFDSQRRRKKKNYQSLWLLAGNHYQFSKRFNFNNFQINFLSFEQSFCISLWLVFAQLPFYLFFCLCCVTLNSFSSVA